MEIRPAGASEIEAFYTTFFRTMGFGPPQEPYLERESKSFVFERSIAAVDAGAIVGTAYSHLFELTLPGATQVRAAGVTAVSVASTHRRRGLLTQIMERQLAEARDRGEPAAILIASEGGIYGRFGYGVATNVVDVRIDPHTADMTAPVTGGRVALVDGETADKVFPGVYDKVRRARAGGIDRPEHFWASLAADRDKKDYHVVYESSAGEPEGYARYAVTPEWKEGIPAHRLTVHELTGSTEASVQLWSYLLNIDLVRQIEAMSRPVDEPVRWLLDEPRSLRYRTYRDMLWLRPLDVATLLSSRRYAVDVKLVLDVTDPTLRCGGRFALDGGPEGAECVPTSAEPDLHVGICELGSIVLGGVAPSDLARAGRIQGGEEALALADATFVGRPVPWTGMYF